MEPLMLVGLVLVGVLAGILGTLFGIGGGIVIIPFLTVLYGFGAASAAAVSLIGIIAISSGGTSFFLKNGIANVRLGLFLEIGTTIGAVVGASIAAYLADWILLSLFSVVMLFSAYRMFRSSSSGNDGRSEDGEHSYYDFKEGREINYDVENWEKGFGACIAAGAVSSMTGVGGGVIKMPVMNLGMKVPIKAAAGTSSYMIGITAFAGSVVYFLAGQIPVVEAGLVVAGSVLGAFLGTRISKHMNFISLKRYFSLVMVVAAVSVALKAGGLL